MYPKTRKSTHKNIYFDTTINDPYSWLEDDLAKETSNWVDIQNEFTEKYLSKISFRNNIEKELTNLWNYDKLTTPFRKGKYLYYFKNDGLQNQNVLYRKKDGENEEVFIDPNTFSKNGTDALVGLSFCKDNSLVAINISESGSDWTRIEIIDTKTKEVVDVLENIKNSPVTWKGNYGFYYSTFERTEKLSNINKFRKLYFHVIDTMQSEDKVIYGNHENEQFFGLYVTLSECERYMFLMRFYSTSEYDLLVKDLQNPFAGYKIISEKSQTSFITINDEKIYLRTNHNSPNYKLVSVDIKNPNIENCVDVIPETENVLNITKAGKYFFANYIVDTCSKVMQYYYDGKLINDINLPDIGTATGFSDDKEVEEVYYSFTNYINPQSIYKYNFETKKSTLFWKPNLDFDTEEFETKQIFYKSKDGTKIPMTISYKKTLKLNGKNPTILYGYGGFNISLQPNFSVTRAVWMKMGGIYAVANLRGGGEYGKKWHDAGRKFNRQNVFDDFIAAAEFLIKEKYTSSEYLAINGGSNGGLLVGSVMLQRPKLFKVAIPEVGVLDMLRYHKFSVGSAWAYDYGTSEENKEMFEYLLKYSPLHNVKEEEYPATLITTSDHDDRVVPAHSFKFAAELQSKQKGENPILILVSKNSGHGFGTPINKIIKRYANIFAFTLYNMNIEYDK